MTAADEPVTEPGVEPGVEPGAEPGAEPGVEPADQPITEPLIGLTHEPGLPAPTLGPAPVRFTGCAQLPASPLLALLAELQADRDRAPRDPGPDISLRHLLVKAVAAALHQTTQAANAPTRAVPATQSEVAFAVLTDRGVLTPVVRDPRSMTVRTLAASMADLEQRARTGSLSPEELAAGGVVTAVVEQGPGHAPGPPSGMLAVPGLLVAAAITSEGAESVLEVSVTTGPPSGPVEAAAAARFLSSLLDVLQRPVRVLV